MGPSLLVAFLAGCGNVLLTNPIWTVATRMQARPDPHPARQPPPGCRLPRARPAGSAARCVDQTAGHPSPWGAREGSR